MRIRGFVFAHNLVSPKGAPVATNKERRPSEARERRGRETVNALETAEKCDEEKRFGAPEGRSPYGSNPEGVIL